MAVLATSTGASATVARGNAIDPGTRVNGMLVYQDVARRAGAALFGLYCDPVVVSPGRRTRTCSTTIPRVRRLFVGHGIFAPTRKAVDKTWARLTWALWIDGERVDLAKFGWTDRWLLNLPAANYKPVVLREWAIMLTGAEGRHSIRYRTRWPSGVMDTTWKFSVARS